MITLSDFECDYLNAQQCCSKLNFWMLPKFIFHAILVFIFLVTGHWVVFILNLPFITYLGYELYKVPPGNSGVYEPTEIYNRDKIKRYLRDCMIYLGFYLIIFFIYLYWYAKMGKIHFSYSSGWLTKFIIFFSFITSLLKGDPIRRHEAEEIISEM